jgi:hypothetical protein
MQKRQRTWQLSAAAVAIVSTMLTGTAGAHGNYLSTWTSLYPNSNSDNNVTAGTGVSCALCHFSTSGGSNWNAYGWKMRQGIQAGQNLSTAITNAANFDSDLDPTGSTNAVEIGVSAQPGWTPGAHNTRYTTGGTTANQSPPTGILAPLDPPSCGTATPYCTSGTTTSGCTATMSMTGTPTVSNSGVCTIAVGNVEGAKQGLIFYGLGRLAQVWGTGPSYLCVKSPTQRTAIANTGGTAGACNGQLSVDINAFWAANPSALGQPLTAGLVLDFQGWFRDPPASKSTSLSNALEVALCP